MKRLALIVIAAMTVLAAVRVANARLRVQDRFRAVTVHVDPGGQTLAAYQVRFSASSNVRIVGIEGGAHPSFVETPYYDIRAIGGERVVLAAFSGASATELPREVVRVATIHVQILGPEPARYDVTLDVAATTGGRPIEASVRTARGDAE